MLHARRQGIPISIRAYRANQLTATELNRKKGHHIWHQSDSFLPYLTYWAKKSGANFSVEQLISLAC